MNFDDAARLAVAVRKHHGVPVLSFTRGSKVRGTSSQFCILTGSSLPHSVFCMVDAVPRVRCTARSRAAYSSWLIPLWHQPTFLVLWSGCRRWRLSAPQSKRKARICILQLWHQRLRARVGFFRIRTQQTPPTCPRPAKVESMPPLKIKGLSEARRQRQRRPRRRQHWRQFRHPFTQGQPPVFAVS